MNILKLSVVVLLNMFISSASHQTNISSYIVRMSSRRKRSLLLPNTGSIKLTIGLGKSLIGNSPKGLSLSLEISNYYAGPTAIKDWLSAVPDPAVNKSGELSIKKAQQKYFQINTKNYKNLPNPYYIPFGALNTTDRFSSVIFDQKPQTLVETVTRKPINRYGDLFHEIYKRSHMESNNALPRRIKDDGYTNRRSPLEEVLSHILGTDVRCSILRSICRSREFLLPSGYSMIQDIIRTIFLAPTGAGEVSSDLCENKSHCDLSDENEHSFNFIDWILNPMKII